MSIQADLSNWREGPQNVWSFVNIEKVLPTQQIKKATSPTILHEQRSSAVEGIKVPVADDKTLDIKALLQATSTDGLVVLHRGKLVYDYCDHGNAPSSKHIIMSISKSLTSLIIGALVDRGLINLDDKVTKYMPELENTVFAGPTIRHLIDMRSGINYPDESHKYRMACGWNPPKPGEELIDIPTFFSTFNPANTVKPSPAGFVYASVGTDVMGLLLQRVTGKSFAELVHEYLFEPAGAEFDGLTTVDKSGNARAAGGIAASVKDLARIGQGIIDGKVVSKAWLDDMLNGDVEVFKQSAWGPLFEPFCKTLTYRSFWLTSGPDRFLMGVGIHGQMIAVDLEKEIVVAKTSSQAEDYDPKLSGLDLRLFRAIQRVL